MAQWYYTLNGQQAGPVDDGQVRAMIANGQLGPADMVWKDGMAEWQLVSAMRELGAGPTYPPQQHGAPQQYGGPQGQPLNYGGYAPPQQYSGRASYRQDAQNAMICSIIGAVCCVILGIIGLVQGTTARNNMRASGNMDGEGMATAAIVIGWVSIGIAVLGFVVRIGLISSHGRF